MGIISTPVAKIIATTDGEGSGHTEMGIIVVLYGKLLGYLKVFLRRSTALKRQWRTGSKITSSMSADSSAAIFGGRRAATEHYPPNVARCPSTSLGMKTC